VTRVDLVDDLEDARQQPAEHGQRPALERLGQQRVIGVRAGLARDGPGSIPVHVHLVDQQAHELATAMDGCVSFIWIANFSWNRSGGIFWILQMRSMSCREHETKKYCCSRRSSLPLACSSLGYSTLVRFLAGHLLVDRAVVIPAIEGAEVEGFGCLGFPQAQCVGRVDAISQDGCVVGNAVNHASGNPARALAAVFVVPDFRVATELHIAAPFGARELPGIAVAQPLVGFLDLPAVDDLLLEDSELVADAVTQRWHFERGQRVNETRGKAAETAIAQARLVLVRQQLFEVEPELGHRRTRGLVDAEIDEVVAEMRAP
jgi:hypothetical protein